MRYLWRKYLYTDNRYLNGLLGGAGEFKFHFSLSGCAVAVDHADDKRRGQPINVDANRSVATESEPLIRYSIYI